MLFKWLRGLRDAAMPGVADRHTHFSEARSRPNRSLTLTRLRNSCASWANLMLTIRAPALALTKQAHAASARLLENRLNYSPSRCT